LAVRHTQTGVVARRANPPVPPTILWCLGQQFLGHVQGRTKPEGASVAKNATAFLPGLGLELDGCKAPQKILALDALGIFKCGDTEIEGAHEPLCTPEQWAAVQVRNSRRKNPKPWHASGKYLLTGLVYCG
jgi:hypothetical protein